MRVCSKRSIHCKIAAPPSHRQSNTSAALMIKHSSLPQALLPHVTTAPPPKHQHLAYQPATRPFRRNGEALASSFPTGSRTALRRARDSLSFPFLQQGRSRTQMLQYSRAGHKARDGPLQLVRRLPTSDCAPQTHRIAATGLVGLADSMNIGGHGRFS